MTAERVTLSDSLGIVAVDGSDRDEPEHATTVDTGLLIDAVEIIETLGWSTVDIGALEATEGPPALVIEPTGDPIFADSNAGLVVAPRTDGRNDGVSDE